jgi:Sortase domain
LEWAGSPSSASRLTSIAWSRPTTDAGRVKPGPAVISGHVDSKTGPAVFYRLRDLGAGDTVRVQRAAGDWLTFEVTGTARYAKAAFPTEAVFGPVTGPVLRLITCGGDFDRASGHYLDNVVVTARPAGGP